MYSYAVLYVAISDKFYDYKAGTVLVVSLNISLPFLVGKDFVFHFLFAVSYNSIEASAQPRQWERFHFLTMYLNLL